MSHQKRSSLSSMADFLKAHPHERDILVNVYGEQEYCGREMRP